MGSESIGGSSRCTARADHRAPVVADGVRSEFGRRLPARPHGFYTAAVAQEATEFKERISTDSRRFEEWVTTPFIDQVAEA